MFIYISLKIKSCLIGYINTILFENTSPRKEAWKYFGKIYPKSNPNQLKSILESNEIKDRISSKDKDMILKLMTLGIQSFKADERQLDEIIKIC